MPVFELQSPDGRSFQVDAADMQSAASAFKQHIAPQSTGTEAFGRGVANGATFNFLDELNGLIRAGGGNPDDPYARPAIEGLMALVKGGYRKATGDPEAQKAYEEQVSKERKTTKQMEEEHPIASVAGNVVGGAAVPVGAGATGLTMGARMFRGAIGGAGVGAAAGFGSGEGTLDSVLKAGIGLPVGAGIGAVAPPVIEGIIQGGSHLATPLINAVRGATDQGATREAARRTVTAIDRDVRNSPTGTPGLTPQEFTANVQGGGPATLMDLGDETTRALARSAANTSPTARARLNDTIDNRFEGQAGRVADWMRSTFNYPNAHAQQEAIENIARTTNDAAYRRSMTEGASGVWDAELQRLAGAPAIQEASHAAIPSLANRGITEGFRAPRQNPLSFDQETGLASLSTLPNGSQRVPDLRFWDQVKKNLDAMIGKAETQQNTTKVGELTGLKNELVRNLDRLVPSYAQARAGAAHFFGAENALEAGQNFVTAKLGNDAARAQLARMTPQERQLFQDGFVSRYVDTILERPDRRDVLNKIAEAPAARERLNMVLGRQRSNELEAMLRVEGVMDLSRSAVQGNSTTIRQLMEMGLAGGAGLDAAYGGATLDPMHMGVAAFTGALLAGRRGIDQRVATRVAQMLTSNDPNMLRLGITLIARNERFMDGLRATDRRLIAAGVQPTSGIGPAVQGPMRAAAQQEQPQPPGGLDQQPSPY